jgi:hypothetical protein
MGLLKTVNGAHGNKIEFWTFEHLDKNQIVVHDCDCLMETVYTIGDIRELNDFEKVKIESFEQVIEAWETGSIWF